MKVVVILSSCSWDNPVELNAHRLAKGLVARGWRVLFVESVGLRLPNLWRVSDRRRVTSRFRSFFHSIGSRKTSSNSASQGQLVVLPLLCPPPLCAPVSWFSGLFSSIQIRRSLRRLKWKLPVFVAMLPWHSRILRRSQNSKAVYYCVDSYEDNPCVHKKLVTQDERKLCESVSSVIVSSQSLQKRFIARNIPARLAENGVDYLKFSNAIKCRTASSLVEDIPKPRLVYSGNIATFKIDLQLLRRIATHSCSWNIILAGPIGVGDPSPASCVESITKLPNVHWVGNLKPSSLVELLSDCQLALLPMRTDGPMRHSMPLKFWEFVSSGLFVVSTRLPNLSQIPQDLVSVCATHTSFISEISRVLSAEAALGRNELAKLRSRRSRAAECHDLGRTIDLFDELLRQF